jgi:aspartate kinase
MSVPIEEIWVSTHVVKVTIRRVKDRSGIAAEVFETLNDLCINAELIVHASATKGRADIAFLVLQSQLPKIQDCAEELVERIGGEDLIVDDKVALIAFYGSKDLSRTQGVAASIFSILANVGVNIEMISTSLDSISLVIREGRMHQAIEAMRDELGIEPTRSYE